MKVEFAVVLPGNIKPYNENIINKYLPLKAEMTRMWKLEEVRIVPVVSGEIPKTLKKNLELLGLNPNLYILMQKSVVQ